MNHILVYINIPQSSTCIKCLLQSISEYLLNFSKDNSSYSTSNSHFKMMKYFIQKMFDKTSIFHIMAVF